MAHDLRASPWRKSRHTAAYWPLALSLGALAAGAYAGPLELRQGLDVGAGTGFRRGDTCLVLTAAHVVKEPGVEVLVQDRTGGTGKGQVVYENKEYDVALVTLAPGFTAACTERWPDSAWLTHARWNPGSMLEARRHYPDGRESVILLRWAGGTADALSLAHTDRTGIRSSDSGALVYQGERIVGLVRSVDTAADRVDVLRLDVIDRLVGDRFRGVRTAGANAVAFEGVFFHGRPHPNWTSYVSAWLTEGAGKTVVDGASQQWRCRVRAEVIDWSQRGVENPRYAELQQSLGTCKNNPLLRRSATAVKMCEDGLRNQLKDTPRQLRVHAVQLKVGVAPRSGPVLNRLRSIEIAEDAASGLSRPQVELQVLQSAFRNVAADLLSSDACS
ncbi:MAG: serine protease [Burkholderiaceae bacterium]|nr:serine protease [Burkholderiaceae bacterium]